MQKVREPGGKARGSGAAAKGRRGGASKAVTKAPKPTKRGTRDLSVINLDSTSDEGSDSDGGQEPSRAKSPALPAAAATHFRAAVPAPPCGGSGPGAAQRNAAVPEPQISKGAAAGLSTWGSPEGMQGSPEPSVPLASSPVSPLPQHLLWAQVEDDSPRQLPQLEGVDDEDEADVPATPPSQVRSPA